MRPHRDATPILLVLVALLFLILVVVKFRDGIYGQPAALNQLQLRKLVRERGEEALSEALEELRGRVNKPDEGLFSMLRNDQAAALSVPVTGALLDLPPEVRLHLGRVQIFRDRPELFVAKDLPHAGSFRLEATFFQEQERIERRLRQVPYRLVRLGPPPPLAKYALVVVDALDLIPEQAGEHLRLAQEDLERLRETRDLLRGRVRELARALVRYGEAFRHLGGDPDQAKEVEQRWLSLLPVIPRRPEVKQLPLDLKQTSLVARWWAVELSRWGSYRNWSGYLMEQRLREQEAFHQSWSTWQRVVKAVFDEERWARLGGGEALDELIATTTLEVERSLGELGAASQRWAALARQILQHHRQISTSFEVVTGEKRAPLLQAQERMDPRSLKRQALAIFQGEGAAARCGSFLESVTGPFAKEHNGVVFLDNRGGGTLDLGEKTIAGRLVLVATGDVRLSNLGPRDSRSHGLTVQVEGRLSLKGKIRANLISRGDLEIAPGSQLVGGLFLGSGGDRSELKGRVEWNPTHLYEDEHEGLEVVIEEPSLGDESPSPEAR